MHLKEIGRRAHETNEKNGFNENWNDAEKLLLAIGEISEAVEEMRDGCDWNETYYSKDTNGGSKPEGIGIEIADAIIRLVHFCHFRGIDLDAAISEKLDYNATRPFKHGRKF